MWRCRDGGLAVHPATMTLAGQAGLQIQVTDFIGASVSRGTHGTRYIVGNDGLLEVTADGFVRARADAPVDTSTGGARTTITVTYEGQQRTIEVFVVSATIGAVTVTAANGGAAADGDGRLVTVGPGALAADARIEIRGVNLADLPEPPPKWLAVEGAFHLDLGAEPPSHGAQLAIPMDPAVPAGSEVHFFHLEQVVLADGEPRWVWRLVDNGHVGADGVARTASRPYGAISSSGFYLASAKRSVDNGSIELRKGQDQGEGQDPHIVLAGNILLSDRIEAVLTTAAGYRGDLLPTIFRSGHPRSHHLSTPIRIAPGQRARIEVAPLDWRRIAAAVPYLIDARIDLAGRRVIMTIGNDDPVSGAIGTDRWIVQIDEPACTGAANDPRRTRIDVRREGTVFEFEMPPGVLLSVSRIRLIRVMESLERKAGPASAPAVTRELASEPIRLRCPACVGWLLNAQGSLLAFDVYTEEQIAEIRLADDTTHGHDPRLLYARHDSTLVYVATGSSHGAASDARIVRIAINPNAGTSFHNKCDEIRIKDMPALAMPFGFSDLACVDGGRTLLAVAPSTSLGMDGPCPERADRACPDEPTDRIQGRIIAIDLNTRHHDGQFDGRPYDGPESVEAVPVGNDRYTLLFSGNLIPNQQRARADIGLPAVSTDTPPRQVRLPPGYVRAMGLTRALRIVLEAPASRVGRSGIGTATPTKAV